MMKSAEISIRLGVADLLARYQRLADSGRLEELTALFLQDAVFETDAAPCHGPEEIRSFFESTATAFVNSGALPGRHHLSSIFVEPRSDGVVSTYACFLWIGSKGPDHWGTYRDEVVESDDGWRFKRRRAIIDGHVSGSPVIELFGDLRSDRDSQPGPGAV
jgi:hypothetical protein